jgi:S1-C subfamily serine protease
VNVQGKLIGINTAYVWQRGIAIPVNKVKAIADRLMTGKVAQRGYLGIIANTVAIPEEIAEAAGLEQETGVMIFSVESGSPARKAGLAMGGTRKIQRQTHHRFYDLPRLLAKRHRQRNKINHHQKKPNETTVVPTVHGGEELISKMPTEIDPPSPMPTPLLKTITHAQLNNLHVN